MLEKGDLDIIQVVSVDDVPALKQNPAIVVQPNPTWSVFMLQLNTQRGPLKDPRVRKAIAYAFDYDGHNQGAMKGMVVPAEGPFPPSMVGKEHLTGLTIYRRDLARAKELLKEAGFPNGGFPLSMNLITGFDEHRKAAEILQANLAELNIQLKIQEMTGPTWTATNSSPDTAPDIIPYWAVPAFNSPNAVLPLIFASRSQGKNGRNWMYYRNPKVDELIDQARGTADTTKRNELHEEIAKLITEDCPALFVNRSVNVTPYRTWVKGYVYNPAYLYMYRFYEISLEGKAELDSKGSAMPLVRIAGRHAGSLLLVVLGMSVLTFVTCKRSGRTGAPCGGPFVTATSWSRRKDSGPPTVLDSIRYLLIDRWIWTR